MCFPRLGHYEWLGVWFNETQKIQGSAGVQKSSLLFRDAIFEMSMKYSNKLVNQALHTTSGAEEATLSGDILFQFLQLPLRSGISASHLPCWIILGCCWSVPVRPIQQAAVTCIPPQAKQHCNNFSDWTKKASVVPIACVDTALALDLISVPNPLSCPRSPTLISESLH